LARKTADPSGRETQVHPLAPAPAGVVAVVGANAVSRLCGPRPLALKALLERLAAVGGRPMAFGVNAELDMLVDRTGIAGKDPATLAPVAAQAGLTTEEVAAVSLVGSNLIGRPQVLAQSEPALAQAGIRPLGHFCSETTATFVVAPDQCDAAVRALHQTLVEPGLVITAS